jgi:quercetin dioxygenase-like cupin family protein
VKPIRSAVLVTTLTLTSLLPGVLRAADPPRERIAPAFNEAIPNIPGKRMIGVVVTYPPGGKTPSHHHPRSAFVTGYVLSGAVRSQLDDGSVRVFHAGETWTEPPGARHTVSENASASKPARLLAIFLVDTNDTNLLSLDPPR